MAVRRPLKLVSGNFREMTTSEVNLIVDEVIRLYGTSPSVELSVDAGNGNISVLSEIRSTAGSLASGPAPWPSADPTSTTSVDYNNTVQSISSLTFPYRTGRSYENFSYPIYRTATDNLQAMNATDAYDTFILPALNRLVLSSTTSESQAGTYFISTSTSETDATLVSNTPIASDTNADIAAFGAGSLPETIDQSTTATNFYLHRIDPVSQVSFDVPVSIKRDTSDMQVIQKTVFQTMMENMIDYYAAQAIRYNYYISTDTSFGQIRGTGITDTYTTDSTTRYEQPDPTTYYAQNVPSGTPTVQKTSFLRIGTI